VRQAELGRHQGADLRGFTTVADRDDPLKVVGWLDEHFDALGEPVQRPRTGRAGEGVRLGDGEDGEKAVAEKFRDLAAMALHRLFLGDGFLAVFPVAEPDALTCPACTGALDAAREALARNESRSIRLASLTARPITVKSSRRSVPTLPETTRP
jgi:adenylate cyclase